jgi:hypothetical protein
MIVKLGQSWQGEDIGTKTPLIATLANEPSESSLPLATSYTPNK